MKLDAFALLIAGPVGEQAEVPMDHGHGHHHIAADAKGGGGAEKAENQTDTAEEFGGNCQESERRGDVHDLGEETHCAGEAIAAKPAERFLRAVREEDYAKNEAKDGDGRIAGSVDELAKHERALLFVIILRTRIATSGSARSWSPGNCNLQDEEW